jgi:chorismate-pyruvate lyase
MSYSVSTDKADARQRVPTGPNVLAFSATHPLDDFYSHAGLKLPRIEIVPGHAVPQPYQQLLVHEGDMTPTLEKFHESAIHLEVLRSERHGDFYFREVVLRTDDEEERVEFGAIKIFLNLFPVPARTDILAERLPLGSILSKYRIEHTSRPKCFLRIESDEFINRALALSGNYILYGRRNTLSTLEGHPLAEIVEILPPAKKTTTNGHE